MVANTIFRMGGAAIAFTNKPSACARLEGGGGGREGEERRDCVWELWRLPGWGMAT
jgi:hypothetical protein